MIQRLKDVIERVFGPSALSPNPRERGLIAALGAVLALIAVVYAFDVAQGARDDAAASLADLRAQERDNRGNGAAVAERIADQVERVRSASFQASTFPIAQVQAQGHLRALLDQAGVQNPRVSADAVLVGEGDVRLFVLTVDGVFDWGTFLAFCEGLARSEQSLHIVSIAVENDRAKNFRMRVQAPLSAAAEN